MWLWVNPRRPPRGGEWLRRVPDNHPPSTRSTDRDDQEPDREPDRDRLPRPRARPRLLHLRDHRVGHGEGARGSREVLQGPPPRHADVEGEPRDARADDARHAEGGRPLRAKPERRDQEGMDAREREGRPCDRSVRDCG